VPVRAKKEARLGRAHERLLALLQEATLRIRRNFGMFGQIHIDIRDVTPELIVVGISTRKPLDGAWLAQEARNAVLNWLQNLLPIERFVAVYENPEHGITGEVHDLPYASEVPEVGVLGSAEILIEQLAGPAREELRPRFRQAWQRYLEEEARSPRGHRIEAMTDGAETAKEQDARGGCS
jgi:hypothetical protein